jgi:hypothetical protein
MTFAGQPMIPAQEVNMRVFHCMRGLICLNGPSEMDLDIHVELFEAALDEIARDPDLVNQVLEVTFDFEADKITLIRYALPP